MPVIDLGKNILVQVIDKLRKQEAEEDFYDFRGIVMRKKKWAVHSTTLYLASAICQILFGALRIP